MNTPEADALIKKDADALAKKLQESDKLSVLLGTIPNVDPDVIPAAVNALIDATYHYLSDRYLVETDGQRSSPGIASARKSIQTLLDHMTAVQRQVAALLPNAASPLAFGYKAPIGKLKTDIEQIVDAIVFAQFSLNKQPNKQPDLARIYLAFQVAQIFEDVLKVTPTATRDDSVNVTGKRGGGAYASVLRCTLTIAGVTQIAIGPLIDSGLAYLRNRSVFLLTE